VVKARAKHVILTAPRGWSTLAAAAVTQVFVCTVKLGNLRMRMARNIVLTARPESTTMPLGNRSASNAKLVVIKRKAGKRRAIFATPHAQRVNFIMAAARPAQGVARIALLDSTSSKTVLRDVLLVLAALTKTKKVKQGARCARSTFTKISLWLTLARSATTIALVGNTTRHVAGLALATVTTAHKVNLSPRAVAQLVRRAQRANTTEKLAASHACFAMMPPRGKTKVAPSAARMCGYVRTPNTRRMPQL
jgi:hypothetical protein